MTDQVANDVILLAEAASDEAAALRAALVAAGLGPDVAVLSVFVGSRVD